jgi:arylformamidase
MNIIDISWSISQNMTQYKDRQSVFIEQTHSLKNDGVHLSKVLLDSHTGTHIDAPCHFLPNAQALDQVPLSMYVGPCQVVDCTDIEGNITAEVLAKQQIESDKIILFKTKNSAKGVTDKFDSNFICITADAAEFLVEKKIKAVGLDYPGLEHHQPGHETHNAFLGNGIGVIEGLRLAHVTPGNYFFCCLPLALQGVDGSPARAILIEGI